MTFFIAPIHHKVLCGVLIRTVLLSLLVLMLPCSGLAEDVAENSQTVAKFRVSDLEATLDRHSIKNSVQYLLTLTPAKGKTVKEADVFSIENPNRLVIDVPNHLSKSSNTINTKDTIVSSVRTGSHPNKTRIVLDLNSSLAPTHAESFDSETGAAIVSFGFGDKPIAAITKPGKKRRAKSRKKAELKSTKIEQASAPAEKAPVASQNEVYKKGQKAKKPSGPEPVIANTVIRAPRVSIEQERDKLLSDSSRHVIVSVGNEVKEGAPQPTGSLAKKVAKTSVRVDGIFFREIKNTRAPAVMVKVANLDTYRLSRTRPDLFELSITGAQLAGLHLVRPQFPPEEFVGFEVILARQRKNDVLIQVYVEGGVMLSPFRVKDELWLKIAR